MLKKMRFMLLMLIIVLIQLPPPLVKASVVANELKVSSAIAQWVLDEPTNTLYAISDEGKSLLFINSNSMNIEKSLALNGIPTDIIKENGRLYIALSNIHQIVIVDMVSRAITETLYTTSDPYRIVKEGDKIYYTEYDQWCDIYEYDLVSKIDKILQVGTFFSPDMAINSEEHILYIGESGLSRSEMIYYSTLENKVIGRTNYDRGRGFPYPSRSIVFDGENVYYAGRDFKPDNPTRFEGDFGESETVISQNVIYANKGLVYTSSSIYDKDTHIKLGDYGLNVNLVEASDNTLYIYIKDKGVIRRFSDSSKVIDGSSIISLISGIPAVPIQASTQSVQINSGVTALQMDSKLKQWVLDEQSNTLYEISEDNKALFFVNAETLNLEKSVTFKCRPTDIMIDGGNLYIALDDSNQIAVVDTASRTITETLYTSSDPYRLVKDGDKIYYTERDQHCDIYEYNLITNTDRKILTSNFSAPDLAINPQEHILYIGESFLSGSNMIYYSTIENKVISKTNYDSGYGFPYPGRYTLFDGQRVYYAGFDFDKLNPTRILGSYGEEDIIYVKFGRAYTNTRVYDTESHSLIGEYGGNLDLYEVSDKRMLYEYSESQKSILKINPETMSLSVNFDSQGGSYVEPIRGVYNTLIAAPAEPTRTGYTFGGWYKEARCLNAWDFAKALVRGDTILYAKWTPNKYTVTFNSQGGSVAGNKIIDYNTLISAPPEPTRANYMFVGWYKEAECINAWDFAADKVTSNTTLYAKWKNIYNVTFNSQGGSEVSPKITEYNSTVTAPAEPARTGYTFGGWFKDAACVNAWNFESDRVTANTTLYAKWTIKKYTISFYSKGGSSVGNINADYNTLIKTPVEPLLTGYTFGGWFKEYACVNAWNFVTDKVTANITLYAKWTKNNYTVSFDSQGGSTVPPSVAEYNNSIAAPAVPTRTGYTFDGWYKEAACINEWNFGLDSVTANTTLYAKWIVNIYVVGFDRQDGSYAGMIPAAYNTLIAAPSKPSRAGYTFVGWYKEEGCVNAWDFAKDLVTSETTLYAKWVTKVSSVALNKSTAALEVGDSETLIAIVNPAEASNEAVNWSSSNISAAVVDSTGKVTAVAVGTAIITVTTADGINSSRCTVTVKAKAVLVPSVLYQGHVQNIGWQDYVKDGALAGTEGRALRVEGFRIKLENAPAGLRIKYKTHVQNIGWQNWVYDNVMAGTAGQALRVEALQIMLEGTDADQYTVQYQAHVENEGWQQWVRDGQISGSFGKAQRIEALRIRIVKKGPSVLYQGHVQNIGWQDYVRDGVLAGTEGRALRVEGFRIKLENAPAGLRIKYKTHVQNIGWQDWVYDNAMAGTAGQALRVEALQIMLEGTDADKYTVQYQAHVENEGWQSWVRDGQISGSFGKSQRIEALRIVIAAK